MTVRFESVRFGTVEVPTEDVLAFPFGLIGLGGLRYTIIDRNPGTGFLWLHSVENPALALPIVRPSQFFSDFVFLMAPEDHERTGVPENANSDVYVTVRPRPNPAEITANLRAPLVVHEGKGYQVLNDSPDAPLQAPLFTLAPQAVHRP